jgi:hypothetical protein
MKESIDVDDALASIVKRGIHKLSQIHPSAQVFRRQGELSCKKFGTSPPKQYRSSIPDEEKSPRNFPDKNRAFSSLSGKLTTRDPQRTDSLLRQAFVRRTR